MAVCIATQPADLGERAARAIAAFAGDSGPWPAPRRQAARVGGHWAHSRSEVPPRYREEFLGPAVGAGLQQLVGLKTEHPRELLHVVQGNIACLPLDVRNKGAMQPHFER